MWRSAGVLIGLQRRRGIGEIRQTAGELGGIENGLAGAVGAAGNHRVGRVYEQCHTAEVPAVQRLLVDHRILEDGFGLAEHCRGVEPLEVPVGEVADEVLDIARQLPVPVDLDR